MHFSVLCVTIALLPPDVVVNSLARRVIPLLACWSLGMRILKYSAGYCSFWFKRTLAGASHGSVPL